MIAALAYTFEETADLTIDDNDRSGDPFAGYDSEPPPAPKLKSKGVIAMDITEQFAHAAQRMFFFRCETSSNDHVLKITGLDVGQLIKDPFFTLFESVGALEVNPLGIHETMRRG